MQRGRERWARALTLTVVGLLIVLVFGKLTLDLLRDVRPPTLNGGAFVVLQVTRGDELALLGGTRVQATAYPGAIRAGTPRYTVAACGKGHVRLGVVLKGDARLVAPRALGTALRTLPSGEQFASATVPLKTCSPNSNDLFFGTGFEVTGEWRVAFHRLANGQGAFAFPRVGSNGIHEAFRIPGVGGRWATPLLLTATIVGAKLDPDDRIDLAKPDTAAGSTSLYWSKPGFVAPLARWTNLGAARKNQRLLIIYSILIGVGASLIGAAVQQTLEGLATHGLRVRHHVKRLRSYTLRHRRRAD
jgi:hypothetical protein